MVNYGKLPDPDKIPHGLVTLHIWPSEVHFDRQLGKTYRADRVKNQAGEWVTHNQLDERWDLRHNYAWELDGFHLDWFPRRYLPKQRDTPEEVLKAIDLLEGWWNSNGFE